MAQLLNHNVDNIECFKNISYMSLPEKKADDKPQFVTVSRDTVAYNKLSELKEMSTTLGTMLNLVGTPNTPAKKFVPYLDALQHMAIDFECKVVEFFKMVDIKDKI
ncbi:MAG: hypothetical protein J1F01_02420 [Oscillospiraceae bacterium]|nr:hypothetical protein [Oscillospiraceae bacterium]